MNEQREIIYKERREVLDGENMHEEIMRMIGEVMNNEISSVIEEGQPPQEWDFEMLNRTILRLHRSSRFP
jgi:preprotein translocase subunit SecA